FREKRRKINYWGAAIHECRLSKSRVLIRVPSLARKKQVCGPLKVSAGDSNFKRCRNNFSIGAFAAGRESESNRTVIELREDLDLIADAWNLPDALSVTAERLDQIPRRTPECAKERAKFIEEF